MKLPYFENGDGARPARVKQMGHVLDLLRDNGIHDQKSLRAWIGGRSIIKLDEAEFHVVTPNCLELDDEHRWYGRDFKIREVIVDCEKLVIQNSAKIIIKDCVFLGSLIIGSKTNLPLELSLDTVVIGDKLTISSNELPVSSASLTNVRSPSLRLDYFMLGNLRIDACAFATTQLTRLTCDTLSVVYSQLGTLQVADCRFNSVRFPPGQVDLLSLRRRPKSWVWPRHSPAAFNAFKIPPRREFDKLVDEMSRSEAVRHRGETLDFLQENSEDRYSRRQAAELKYQRALAESPGRFSTALIVLTGALVKPMRIVCLAALVIFFFAVAYFFCDLRMEGMPVKSFGEAFYFSGLTFTTIGYGDITPVGLARLLAVLEGLFGIVLSSALVVSLVRRHIE